MAAIKLPAGHIVCLTVWTILCEVSLTSKRAVLTSLRTHKCRSEAHTHRSRPLVTLTISVQILRYPQAWRAGPQACVRVRTMHARDARVTHGHAQRRMGRWLHGPSKACGSRGLTPECSPWCALPRQHNGRTARRELRPSRGQPKGPGSPGVDSKAAQPARLSPARPRPPRRVARPILCQVTGWASHCSLGGVWTAKQPRQLLARVVLLRGDLS